MKKSLFLPAILIMVLIAGTTNVQAQKDKELQVEKRVVVHEDDQPPMHCNIPGLSEDQQSAINKLRIEHQKKARLIHATIKEKRAHLNTLRLAENIDMQQVNKTIDEIASLQADLMKERESHIQAVRSKLNNDQREWFDSQPMQNHFGGPGMFKGERGGRCCQCCDGVGEQFGRRGPDGPRHMRMRLEQDDEDDD
ncbi:MAG TPA: periplasmic heavy metal sensor [Lentimicrobium sp.]|nr:periplasmic heavy metal sensor [Lentimicrobium sp.]